MSLERIPTGVIMALADAALPLAGVLLLARADVVFVDVVDQLIHVAQVASFTILPFTKGDLLVVLIDGTEF